MCAGTGNFDSTKSSTFKNLNKNFSVSYSKGYAAGTIGQDVVQMAGFTIPDQTFGKFDYLSSPNVICQY
jgi:hypothetical protein